MSESRYRYRLYTLLLALAIAGGALGLAVGWLSAASPEVVHAAPGDSLYPSVSDRFGIGVNPAYSDVTDYDVAVLGAGWYVDWRTRLSPPFPAGLDYMQIVRLDGDTFQPDLPTIADIARANPGVVWIVGNEPDCVWQDSSTPDQYARVYQQVYRLLKSVDPTSRVTIGGIVQVTPLRLQWLEAVLSAYQSRYGEPFPVDLWNIHTFILQEKSCMAYPLDCWGAEIPPGIGASIGVEWAITEHDHLPYIVEQIERFRQWMYDRGDRDKELIVSEYGILMPDSYGYDAARVETFMLGTFDYFLNATDPVLGLPADGNRLVQRWAWYSLNDKRFEGHTSHSHLFDPDSKALTPLGIAFRDYVSPLFSPYVDVLPAAIAISPSQPLASGSQPVTITLTGQVRNGGNTDTGDVSVYFWVGDPSQAIGVTQTLTTLPARSLGSLSVEWTGVTPGPYVVGVTVDASNGIVEADEGNNERSRQLLVALQRMYLPFVARNH